MIRYFSNTLEKRNNYTKPKLENSILNPNYVKNYVISIWILSFNLCFEFPNNFQELFLRKFFISLLFLPSEFHVNFNVISLINCCIYCITKERPCMQLRSQSTCNCSHSPHNCSPYVQTHSLVLRFQRDLVNEYHSRC